MNKLTRRRLLRAALISVAGLCTPAMAQVPTHSDKLGTFDLPPGNYAGTGAGYFVLLVPAEEVLSDPHGAKWRLSIVSYGQPGNRYMVFTMWEPEGRTLREQLDVAEALFCTTYGIPNEDLIGRMYGEDIPLAENDFLCPEYKAKLIAKTAVRDFSGRQLSSDRNQMNWFYGCSDVTRVDA